MSDLQDNNPPYHLVNHQIGKHTGPFTTYLDAALARNIGGGGWEYGEIMNRHEFTQWLERDSAAKGRR
jgi:hypothetical protein